VPCGLQVASVVLEWINNHFLDFETDANLSEFLEKLELIMEKQVCYNVMTLLHRSICHCGLPFGVVTGLLQQAM